MKQKLIDFYLDYVNNYLTIDKFAEDNQLSKEKTIELLDLGRNLQIQELEKSNLLHWY